MKWHLHGSVPAILESRKSSCVEEGDMAQQMSSLCHREEGKVYARGQIFNAELQNLQETPQFIGEYNHTGLYLTHFCSLVCSN